MERSICGQLSHARCLNWVACISTGGRRDLSGERNIPVSLVLFTIRPVATLIQTITHVIFFSLTTLRPWWPTVPSTRCKAMRIIILKHSPARIREPKLRPQREPCSRPHHTETTLRNSIGAEVAVLHQPLTGCS